jgi:hypothetical protein
VSIDYVFSIIISLPLLSFFIRAFFIVIIIHHPITNPATTATIHSDAELHHDRDQRRAPGAAHPIIAGRQHQ